MRKTYKRSRCKIIEELKKTKHKKCTWLFSKLNQLNC